MAMAGWMTRNITSHQSLIDSFHPRVGGWALPGLPDPAPCARSGILIRTWADVTLPHPGPAWGSLRARSLGNEKPPGFGGLPPCLPDFGYLCPPGPPAGHHAATPI
jgi:hypothetical protein